jgi:hypothetical protein
MVARTGAARKTVEDGAKTAPRLGGGVAFAVPIL